MDVGTIHTIGRVQPVQEQEIDLTRIFFDLETTGLNKRSDEILQLAICNIDGEPVWDALYDTERIIDWHASARIHGIYPEHVAGLPIFADDVETVQKIFDAADEIYAYNASFDVSFIERYGVKIPSEKVRDTMKEYATVQKNLGNGKKNRKLVDAASACGYHKFDAHNALGDVQATAHVQRWVDKMADKRHEKFSFRRAVLKSRDCVIGTTETISHPVFQKLDVNGKLLTGDASISSKPELLLCDAAGDAIAKITQKCACYHDLLHFVNEYGKDIQAADIHYQASKYNENEKYASISLYAYVL